jgi:hypothetical protein
MKTVEELKIWLEQEQILQFHLSGNDSLLLEMATIELADMRVALIHNETPELRVEYTDLYKTLTDLLALRVDKFARGLR